MLERLARIHERLTLGYPIVAGLLLIALLAWAVVEARGFRLDASADTLVLEQDEDLAFYREVRARYGAEDFLVVAYTPRGELFAEATLHHIRRLRDELAGLPRVDTVVSLLDLPLIDSPRVSLSTLLTGIRTLNDPRTDRGMARRELQTSPLYRDLVMNPEGTTTAILIELRDEGLDGPEAQARLRQDIAAVREVLDRYRDQASIHLGGVPMIAADMIDFVRDDLRNFGIGVALFIILLLALAFRRLRWVVVPASICAASVVVMLGLLGRMGWPVTVVSSNFLSLLLIISLSLCIHLVVQYRELHLLHPGGSQAALLRETLGRKFVPSLFTALTTMVCFASLAVSGIRPVIDFGLMMTAGTAVAFLLCFLMFPAMLARLAPGMPPAPRRGLTAGTTRLLARFTEGGGRFGLRWWLCGLLAVLAVSGVARLTVENRFIDYFQDDTEIHRGMLLVDRELGGTTPLDVVLDPPEWFREHGGSGSYWYNATRLAELAQVHEYLEALPHTGKVLSMATTMAMVTHINNGTPPGNFSLGLMQRLLPDSIKARLFDPYMTPDGNQVRFSVRLVDSDPGLRRAELLRRIEHDLVADFGLEPEQVHLTGLVVLHNNVVQSLFRSQVLTMVVVFLAIALMFGLQFRSARMALAGVMPTLIAAAAVLGLLGWLGVPLDIMTVTIAAITIGIGVDDAIHYAHRFREEVATAGYAGAVARTHASVGRAIVYTTVVIALGFSILALSNFVPTIRFGLFTGLAMVVAMIANLSLLPRLLLWLRPFPEPKA